MRISNIWTRINGCGLEIYGNDKIEGATTQVANEGSENHC